MVSSHGGLFVRMVLGVLVLMLVPSARAQAPTLRWTKSWKECVDLAKTESKSIFVCFTGLQWDPGSPDFLKKVVQDEAVAKVIGDMYVAIHYDLPMKPDRKVSAEAAAEGRELAKRFGLHGVHCLPRVLLVTKDERVYGRVGPVGGPDEFLRWVREWEEARVATEVAPVDAAEADRCTREAIAALNLKNPTKGLEWARQAIAANAASPSARYVMGNILLDMGQHGPARQHYMAALAIDSTGNPRDAATSTSTAGSWFNLAAIESREKREAAMVFCWRENQRTDWRTNGPVERMMDFHTQKSKPEFCLEEFEEMMSRSRFSPTWIERYLTLSEAITKGK